jgi:putative inorganic carbon (HCO3(-)) transporter
LKNIKPNFEDVGSGRFEYWEKAITIFRSSPVWGTGFNTYANIVKQDPNHRTWRYAHNCYLQMAAETGLLGLGCFLWLLAALFGHCFNSLRHFKAEDDGLTVLQGALSGLVGFLVQSFFDNTFYTVQLGIMMWLIFGLAIAATRLTYES